MTYIPFDGETYIGVQRAVECPDCGKQAAIANVEMIPHDTLPIEIPVGRCWACGFMWSDCEAEAVISTYVAEKGATHD